MSEHDERHLKVPDLQGLDPKQPFYLGMSASYTDGSLNDLQGEGVEYMGGDEDEAIETLKELNAEYPSLDGYVFYCVPVAHIGRGKVRVTRIKKK